MKRLMAALAVAAVGLSSAIATVPAQAASKHNCNWPNVCLYDGTYTNKNPFVSIKTTAYHNLYYNKNAALSHQNRADSVVNSLNDDSVWLLDTGPSPDRYLCIPANTAVNLGDYAHPSGGTWANKVDTIKIWGDPDNGKCSGTTQVKQGSVRDGWRP